MGLRLQPGAGEDIRILDLAETPEPPGLVDHDFWLVDEGLVVLMHHDDAGQFLSGEALPEKEAPRYVAARDVAWAAATPFEPWWVARPQHHRCARRVERAREEQTRAYAARRRNSTARSSCFAAAFCLTSCSSCNCR